MHTYTYTCITNSHTYTNKVYTPIYTYTHPTGSISLENSNTDILLCVVLKVKFGILQLTS